MDPGKFYYKSENIYVIICRKICVVFPTGNARKKIDLMSLALYLEIHKQNQSHRIQAQHLHLLTACHDEPAPTLSIVR